MNITVILIELGIMCAVFLVLIIGLLLISPLAFISDYPPEIQEQYYKSQNKESVKEQMTLAMKIKKVVALIAFMFIFAWMLHIAGADSFIQGVLLSYLYMLVLFAWDTFFLDWILFANIKRLRLPGTEHMEREYHQKWFHIKACIPMIPVFMIGGVLSSLLMILIW
ncbi:MAG: hypothetical protein MJ184_10665 [Treponema sp.]|uniref:hypothetical protein n=1 Tax=Treponema sp. TaxID=166 RepID=UPI00298E6E38|nr:hypothetical protein [Treponema sp.]MCQ2601809.1 hypothetical protein [Treponema sp.]